MFIAIPLSNNVRTQIDAADSILEELKTILVNPLIAGGAPRDWYFNVRAKDIDIFVDPQSTTELMTKLTELECRDIIEQTGENLPEHYRSDYITSVISFNYRRQPMQIIVKNSTENPLMHFPCSLCLITYKDFSINPTNDFLTSVHLGRIDILETCSMKYIKKITKRFYTYELEVVSRFKIHQSLRQEERRTETVFDF